MSKLTRRIGPPGFLSALLAATAVMAEVGAPPKGAAEGEALVLRDGQRIAGRLRGDAATGFVFVPDGGAGPIGLEAGSSLVFEGPGPGPTASYFPFRVEMGLGQRISGRLGAIDHAAVRLTESSAGGPVTIARPGTKAVIQRPGEVLVFQDGFEAIDHARWTEMGEAELVDRPRMSGEHALRIPAGGASLTYRLPEPVGSGRLDLAFHDDGAVVAGQQWFVDLTFRGTTGAETVRAVLGWSEESLSVESPSGPALAVQRLARKAGWHRLSLRFGPSQTEIAVDENDLAHGKGPGGPLSEVRLSSFITGKNPPPENLGGTFDDLLLVRFTEPLVGLETDPNQDEVRLAGGDQLFGMLGNADDVRLRLKVDDREVSLPWSEVSGVYLRRVVRQGTPVEGLLVRLEWRAAPGGDPSDLDLAEGALTAVSETTLTLATPYAGQIKLPRDRRRSLRVLGNGVRIVIDPTAHHLGDRISPPGPPLDPPRPEGGLLERSVELARIPPGPASLVLDVVHVEGEGGNFRFGDRVQKGELLTNVFLNDRRIDYLNRHITTKNETPERIRLPIPPGLLRPGRNAIRFEQVGQEANPSSLDNLGLLCIALEFEAERPARPGPALEKR